MALFLSPICNDQTFDSNGDPLNAGQIETYLAGSSTPAATYTDDGGGTPHSNPIILNSLGYPTAGAIWLTGGISYKFIIKNAAGATLRTIDDISGINDASVSQSEWVESGFVPTYIGATSFSVPGDQTAILQINRRTRTTNTSGFIYSTISNSAFAAGITTVTLTNDAGTLDAGLSLVAYALLSATDDSLPAIAATRFTMSTARVLGRDTASTGPVEELTASEVRTLAGLVIGTDVLAPTGNGAALTGMGRRVNQILTSFSGAVATTATLLPWDDTIPQSGEGGEFYTIAITPASATSLLEIVVDMQLTSSATAQLTAALFKDSETDARAANSTNCLSGAQQPNAVSFRYFMTSGSTSSMTFKVRAGASSGTTTVNGSSGARRLGGVHVSGFSITEYLPA